MSSIETDATPKSRPSALRILGLCSVALALTLAFALARFPYQRLAGPLSQAVQDLTPIKLTIGEIGPSYSLLGPGLALRDTRAEWPGNVARIDEFSVRPAWSTSWFRGDPSLYIRINSPIGRASGQMTLGDSAGWDGRMEDVDLTQLPVEDLLADFSLEGELDAEIDVHRTGEETGPRLEGNLTFEVSEGSLALPTTPIGIPFTLVRGDIGFGGDVAATVRSIDLQGDLLLAGIEGTIDVAEQPGNEPLDLDLLLEVKDPSINAMLRRSGIRLDKDGSASLKIAGTLSRPTTR